MLEYVSPGGAFSSAFADSQLQRQQLTRQAMLDDLTRRKTESEIALGQAALAEKRQEHQDTLDEKERNQVLNEVAGLAVGDIPDADLMARAKKHHVPIRTAETAPTAPESLPGIAAVPVGQAQTGITNTRVGAVPNPAAGPTGAVRFAGSPKQAEENAKQQKIDGIVKQISGLDPTSPQFRELATQYEMIAGKSLPAALMGTKPAGTDQEAVFRQNPTKGTVERLQNGAWVTWNGDVPKGAHFMTEPDHSGAEAVRAQTTAKQLETVQEHAYAELNKWAAPVQGHLDAIRELGTMINAKTPEADKLIAPLVIKATIAGQGSGFRMTRAEIENVVGGRSHWETLQAALQQWSLDPTKALSLTDSQREDLRSLTKKIRDKATKLSRQITDARHTIDDATDVKTITRARTRLQEDLATMDDADNGTSGGTGTGKRIVYGMDGKPVKD